MNHSPMAAHPTTPFEGYTLIVRIHRSDEPQLDSGMDAWRVGGALSLNLRHGCGAPLAAQREEGELAVGRRRPPRPQVREVLGIGEEAGPVAQLVAVGEGKVELCVSGRDLGEELAAKGEVDAVEDWERFEDCH